MTAVQLWGLPAEQPPLFDIRINPDDTGDNFPTIRGAFYAHSSLAGANMGAATGW